MNQELALELYRAGFSSKEYYFDEERGSIYVPTLSELIAACGSIQFKLHHYPAKNADSEYFVVERPHEFDMERRATPEEAVARLWLALNRKEIDGTV